MIDAVVIGGGFYGVAIACDLVLRRGLRRVRLVEKESSLLTRASYRNQARIHNGYHYPRSYVTAYRSRINLPRFIADFPKAARRDFIKLYAIARQNSKVSALQFRRFCKEIGARLEPAGVEFEHLFDRRLVEAVFLVEEFAFDASELQSWAFETLAACDVEVSLGQQVLACRAEGDSIGLEIAPTTGEPDSAEPRKSIKARYVFNCTYSGINHLRGDFRPVSVPLKHEITEMGLLEMPSGMRDIGVTLMDGPFFSVMPFPPRGLHTLSHVRYTPHSHWYDETGRDPYELLARYTGESRVGRMVRDARRYMPGIEDAVIKDSLLEIKTVLVKNEGNDGRPILCEKSEDLPGFYSILGGKIDNIYDVLERLETEDFVPVSSAASPVRT